MGDEETIFGYPIVWSCWVRQAAIEEDHKIMTGNACVNLLDNRLVSDLDYWLGEGTRIEWAKVT